MIVKTDHSRPPLQIARVPISDQYSVTSDQWPVVSGRASATPAADNGPQTTDHPSSVAALRRVDGLRKTSLASHAYTLLELLTVITIMGLIAALAAPTLRALKPNAKVAATRQLLDAVGRARQLAISQRTTVYMVFLSTNLASYLATASVTNSWNANDLNAAMSLLDKQLTGYAYVTLRSVGDQPGAYHPTYLSSWRTLPQGAYIPPQKFNAVLTFTNTDLLPGTVYVPGRLRVPPFSLTNNIPFPLETTRPPPYIALPYIAFDGMGQLVSGVPGQPELIPVSEGIVSVARDSETKVALAGQAPTVRELPPGNTLQNYSLVYIDRLTGRAHVERRKVQ
jgi:prepilin-type N-terminal cleavage/methylation domain-containing protein